MAKTINVKPLVISSLRSTSIRWGPRNEALKLARKERGIYCCEECKEEFKRKEIVIDHTDPVIDPSIGWVNWDTFINRLFCPVENFQALCRSCHSIKSDIEADLRKFHKRYVKIIGYEKEYEVNKKGVVRSTKTKTHKKVEIRQNKDGRHYCVFTDNTEHYIDDLIMNHFTDDWYEDCIVIHKDFNPTNLLFSNLEIKEVIDGKKESRC